MSLYFFHWDSLRFREITYTKNAREHNRFLLFLLHQRVTKKAGMKRDVFFLHALFLEKEENYPAKCFPINLSLT